jgi:phosphoribosylamine--glycine ligase
MKVLIVGGGGREHALAWKVAQSAQVEHIFVAPGNAGTAAEPRVENVGIEADDVDALLVFVTDHRIDLTIVGPEAPLVQGIVDRFQENGLKCFGPTRAAARLEGSKSFTKDFLVRHSIPTAAYRSFDDIAGAERYIRKIGAPIVVKADGLAAGKGVFVAQDEQRAVEAVSQCLQSGQFGSAGARVVIEEFLVGEEASFICMVDGEHILPLASSQDHKARDDGDTGPNTGGMGAYSPAAVITESVHHTIMEQIIGPTVRGLAQEGMPYTGFLYAGLMIADDGSVNVVEYNCRFGDPEAQPILMRLKSDLVALCELALQGRLDQAVVEWDPRAALGVVMAAGGYPDAYGKGYEISGLGAPESSMVKTFHGGTRIRDGEIVTSGGRVLCVTALGDNVSAARASAYGAVSGIHWQDVFYRTDIGYRAVHREQ